MKNILIIESNLKLIEEYSDTLKNAGYQITTALDGDTGINEAINTAPQLILCNTNLFRIDGFGVLAVLSKNPITAQIPFIFISLNSKLTSLRKGMEMGADDFITRPFQNNQLVRAVDARINKLKTRNPNPKTFDSNKFENLEGLQKLYEVVFQSNNKRLKKKQTLYFDGDHSQGIYFLDEGCIKTIKLNNDGRELITGLYKSKSFIGLDSLLLNSPLTESAEAVENSSVYFISKKTVLDLLDEYTELNQHIIKILSINLKQKDDQLMELAYESVRKRLSKVLIRLNNDASPIDHINISRDELAGLTGIATETVSRILSDFKDQGFIEKNGSQIHIIDLDSLKKIKN
ncbi:cyclic nucleotide-binding domain-containing protein [Pedobacter sp. B4-66]|uniref:cyclic nucleotide-binding domain-containing protein n=1 Tax=Pedobacter sp. B4-66 TaxID=2817280 RepID=UPI001BD9B76D|nr:cyclic nucleotide-binding domain-containing protein [Pedobacter sp. B4-66]